MTHCCVTGSGRVVQIVPLPQHLELLRTHSCVTGSGRVVQAVPLPQRPPGGRAQRPDPGPTVPRQHVWLPQLCPQVIEGHSRGNSRLSSLPFHWELMYRRNA